jgi:hypothetical protein
MKVGKSLMRIILISFYKRKIEVYSAPNQYF